MVSHRQSPVIGVQQTGHVSMKQPLSWLSPGLSSNSLVWFFGKLKENKKYVPEVPIIWPSQDLARFSKFIIFISSVKSAQ